MISAQEAYRIGLVNEVVPAANLIGRAEADPQADRLANAPGRRAAVASKPSTEEWTPSQSEGFALEASYFGLCAATEDKREGTQAFLKKRAPQFHGLLTR